MASNPAMCLSVDEWRARFLWWLREPTPEALLEANIVFDFRPLYGDTTLTDALASWLHGYTTGSTLFLRLMVHNALETEPPLGVMRAFATDDDPEQKGTLDLKVRGTRIFVDAARVFALGRGIRETGTAASLRVAGSALGVEPRHVEATVDAFHFLQLLRLRQQEGGGGHPNRIDPDALNEVEQRMLKEAFRQARCRSGSRRRSASDPGQGRRRVGWLDRSVDFLLGGPRVGGALADRLSAWGLTAAIRATRTRAHVEGRYGGPRGLR